jgi:hypothetical protein
VATKASVTAPTGGPGRERSLPQARCFADPAGRGLDDRRAAGTLRSHPAPSSPAERPDGSSHRPRSRPGQPSDGLGTGGRLVSPWLDGGNRGGHRADPGGKPAGAPGTLRRALVRCRAAARRAGQPASSGLVRRRCRRHLPVAGASHRTTGLRPATASTIPGHQTDRHGDAGTDRSRVAGRRTPGRTTTGATVAGRPTRLVDRHRGHPRLGVASRPDSPGWRRADPDRVGPGGPQPGLARSGCSATGS